MKLKKKKNIRIHNEKVIKTLNKINVCPNPNYTT